MTKVHKMIFTVYFIIAFSHSHFAQKIYDNPNHHWKPVADDIFLQEVSEKIFTDDPITSAAVLNDKCYVEINGRVFIIDDGSIKNIPSSPSSVNRLISVSGFIWALSNEGIYRFKDNWELIDDRKFVDVCLHLGEVYAATKTDVYKIDGDKLKNIEPKGGYYTSNMTMMMEDGTQLLADPVKIGPVYRIASYSETLYILRYGQLALFDGKIVNQDFIDWGSLPSSNTRDLLSFGNRIYLSTDRGLCVLRGAALTTLTGKDGLPYDETTCLKSGFENDIWIGTEKGAIRKLENDWHFFGADHWLPGNHVNDIAVGNNVVYIATEKGLGIIKYEPYTLRKKADYYERHLTEWGHKRLGFIHTIYKRNDQWIREISDNDGGHTAPYLAAMCYKYAVTGDETARAEAVKSFEAMLWLDRINPIDGLIARAIWSTTGDLDEMGRHGSGGLPAKWNPTDDGKWYWKGDTSSDEIMAHLYSVSIFHDIVAKGREKALARDHLDRMSSYIIDNGWKVIDLDGKPTRWGRWDADYLLNPYGWVDKGVNGLEAQAIAKTAFAVTGKEKYQKAFKQLMDWGYHNYTVRQKNTFPPENIAPWDDNLAYRAYYSLIRNTTDPQLRSIYQRSLERTWEVKRMEHISWFNFGYGVMSGNDCEEEKAAKHLREWTLDCVEHNYRNSHRNDLATEPGYVAYGGGTRAISPREASVSRGSRSSLNYDGGAGGRRVMEPTGFLRDYWMARYHGMIEAPKTDDDNLISVKPRKGEKFGAAPYKGSDRPEFVK